MADAQSPGPEPAERAEDPEPAASPRGPAAPPGVSTAWPGVSAASPGVSAASPGGSDPPVTVPTAPGPPPVVVPRWIQLVLLPLAIVAAFELARGIHSTFVVLVAASVIALILNPLVKVTERALSRALGIVVAYLVVAVIFAGVVAVLAAPVANEVNHVATNFPRFVHSANRELADVQRFLGHHHINVKLEPQGQGALQSLEKQVVKSSGTIVSFARDVLGQAVSFSADLVLTFVLSIYLLAYARPIGELVRHLAPPGNGTPSDDYPLQVQRAVSGYVRGQLLFSLVMGGSAAVAMEIMGLVGVFPDGARFTLFFGLFYALMELIPYIGPILGPVPPIFVALVTNPISAVWVLIVFIALQQLEGHVVAPQLFRATLRINPILVILALLIGFQLYGIVGALLALPVATIVRQTVLYLRAHLVFERWDTPRPGGL